MTDDEVTQRRLENARRAFAALSDVERFELLIEFSDLIDREALPSMMDRRELDDVCDTLGFARRRRVNARRTHV